MLTHLAQSPTYIYEVWKITARDGLVAAYAACSRPIVFGGVTYAATPNEPSRAHRRLGLTADGAELTATYDEYINRADLQGGRWEDARILKNWVYYFDPDGYGTALPQKGFVGKVQPRSYDFTLEFRSLSSRLDMPIGILTSPIDRRRRIDELGIDPAPYIETAVEILSVTDRKVFVVDLTGYGSVFRYGVASFTDGDNAGQEIEIKSSADSGGGCLIELQYPARAAIPVGGHVTLMQGYDGTLDAAKALGEEVVIGMEAEVTMPLPDDVLRYEP
jgi:uncharacterized phage protein (TIGR02218 family)